MAAYEPPGAAAWEAMSSSDAEDAIKAAMRARAADFKRQAESMTLQGVRRELEKNMGLKTGSLDSHKRFIKNHIEEILDSADVEKLPVSVENEVDAHLSFIEQCKDGQLLMPKENASSSLNEKENVPCLDENGSAPEKEKNAAGSLSEDIIKEAIRKRAPFFRKNNETITLQEARRILESDLKVEKKGLDAYKSLIGKSLEEILDSPKEDAVASQEEQKRSTRKRPRSGDKLETKDLDGQLKESRSHFDASDDEKQSSSKKKLKKSVVSKSEGTGKKQKSAASEKQKPAPAKKMSKKSRDLDVSDDLSEENSSEAKPKPRKQEKPTQAYGRQVEHLKNIIKLAGMSVTPLVYKRVKQAPENKREAYLIKELEAILEKEGLSSNSTEKEIKAVKRKKERARDLEGIDMSNIITSSRRSRNSDYIPLPKPVILSESDDEDDNDDVDDDDTDDDKDGSGAELGEDEAEGKDDVGNHSDEDGAEGKDASGNHSDEDGAEGKDDVGNNPDEDKDDVGNHSDEDGAEGKETNKEPSEDKETH